jgi:hypothetical protein
LRQKVGAWLKLTWGDAYTVNQVVLHDRPNSNDQITSATLSFSDGSSVTVGTLANNGARVNGETINVGHSEIEVYGY